MASFTVAFLWLFCLPLVSGIGFVLALFVVYRLTDGKRPFLDWLRAMRF